MRTQLAALPDRELLARLRVLPPRDVERDRVCEILVVRYSRLVWSCAGRYRDSEEPVEDLVQIGYVGLLKAINNFDPVFANGLYSYAEPYITGELRQHFRNKRWHEGVSRHAQELVLAIRIADDQLTQQLGRSPQASEVARRLGVGEDDVRDARQADVLCGTYSLDGPVSGNDDATLLADILGEEDLAVQHAIDITAAHVHIEELPEREQRILALRFYGNLTQSEIGARLGIPQVEVSRLLRSALSYLRQCLTADRLPVGIPRL